MLCMDVYSKAWLLLWKGGLNRSLREEGSSLWRADFLARRNGRGMGAWAKEQAELPRLLFDFRRKETTRRDRQCQCSDIPRTAEWQQERGTDWLVGDGRDAAQTLGELTVFVAKLGGEAVAEFLEKLFGVG